jgi:hypothetical protein
MVMLDDAIQGDNSPQLKTIHMRWPFNEDKQWEDFILLQKASGLDAKEFLRRETLT